MLDTPRENEKSFAEGKILNSPFFPMPAVNTQDRLLGIFAAVE